MPFTGGDWRGWLTAFSFLLLVRVPDLRAPHCIAGLVLLAGLQLPLSPLSIHDELANGPIGEPWQEETPFLPPRIGSWRMVDV
ncbi:uncharacterized protein BO66DRAFT_152177 [Aspergillus aculeatinus CBS 121060]|uniref:Uncharacterized protein n=1 Tax=Aspergillus aculeatinus CBS 121060 TaxID=1448322 RepID=A0ACD1H2R4_9EURO|nr:hypothetical protein BO66DRAFT_152177 [Aspergillus aculeatinus CBS 121060]RAH67749.1 hypothetical protein BO66DRAFT_152177 [Aspergillus aculeatinus CBS 121060]